jgi:hypothetical protein
VQPTEWQNIGNQINAATILARVDFVNVLIASIANVNRVVVHVRLVVATAVVAVAAAAVAVVAAVGVVAACQNHYQ